MPRTILHEWSSTRNCVWSHAIGHFATSTVLEFIVYSFEAFAFHFGDAGSCWGEGAVDVKLMDDDVGRCGIDYGGYFSWLFSQKSVKLSSDITLVLENTFPFVLALSARDSRLAPFGILLFPNLNFVNDLCGTSFPLTDFSLCKEITLCTASKWALYNMACKSAPV